MVAVYTTTKEAVEECRAGHGPVLIEVKTHRMKGHAQHDPAEYVPKEMVEYWKARDPIARYEKFLTENKIWDAKTKSEIDARIEHELDEDQKFAEESPLPPPELAEQGVYCDGCHTIEADWQRSKKELTPPNCSVDAVWEVKSFGSLDPEAAAEMKAAAQAKQVASRRLICNDETDSRVPGQRRATIARVKAAPKVPPKASAKPPRQRQPLKTKNRLETAAALRVPFGRGPKDKAFRKSARRKKRKLAVISEGDANGRDHACSKESARRFSRKWTATRRSSRSAKTSGCMAARSK